MVITGVTIENYVRGEKERGEGMGHPRVSKTYEHGLQMIDFSRR